MALLNTKKRPARKSLHQAGWITLEGGFAARQCVVKDMSATGAKVTIDDPNSFRNRVASAAPGTEGKISVVRDGQLREMSARLGELKPESGRSGRFFDR